MTGAKRPYVICHMIPSLDGRIVTKGWKLSERAMGEYERTAETFDADAWMIGRISMEPYAGKAKVPARKSAEPIPRTDFIAKRDADSYAIALDPSGKLTWKSGSIDEEHVITILTEEVSDDYLAFLQSKGVSYLFGGKADLNLKKVLEKLRKEFGIKRLLLEGGGKINGSFLAADLIDELSILVAPIADGSVGTPSLFDAREGRGPVRQLKLLSAEPRKGDLVWLRYKLRK
ncbi:RibD family protein [Corallococcus macrosporus]|uniref:Deaminase reductase n=1 Tax=Corallococcus macrosporus DSM 14697 TaxID=1189310 RepID=A0A250JY75_9BACT|nr:RibD family protein [Corallococcus macrosporus]ATB48795.1 deaminase reductase [Corallococcus macrosporus DSM 14697]